MEESIFIDKRHSPKIEMTKIEAKTILYFLELQSNGYWRKDNIRGIGNIETVYNELSKLVRNRKSQQRKWKWFKESKSRILKQREYNKCYREKQKLKQRTKAKEHYQQPEVIVRRKEYYQQPEVKQRMREYARRPKVKQKRKEHREIPEVRQKLKEYKKKYDAKIKKTSEKK